MTKDLELSVNSATSYRLVVTGFGSPDADLIRIGDDGRVEIGGVEFDDVNNLKHIVIALEEAIAKKEKPTKKWWRT